MANAEAEAAQQQHARVTSGQNSVTNYGFLDFRKKLSLVLLFINISFWIKLFFISDFQNVKV